MSDRRLNFAPVSAAQSTGLRVSAGWFIVNGVVLGAVTLALVIGLLAGTEVYQGGWMAAGMAITTVVSVGSVFAGWLILHERRLGGIIAVLLVLAGPASRVLQGIPLPVFDIVFAVVSVLILLSIWRELN